MPKKSSRGRPGSQEVPIERLEGLSPEDRLAGRPWSSVSQGLPEQRFQSDARRAESPPMFEWLAHDRLDLCSSSRRRRSTMLRTTTRDSYRDAGHDAGHRHSAIDPTTWFLAGLSVRGAVLQASGPDRDRMDPAVVVSDRPAAAAAGPRYFKNRVKAALVRVHMNASRRTTRGVIVRSGNANACTGPQGMPTPGGYRLRSGRSGRPRGSNSAGGDRPTRRWPRSRRASGGSCRWFQPDRLSKADGRGRS
jgi:hypothetical protein